jgi:hypothetical protein
MPGLAGRHASDSRRSVTIPLSLICIPQGTGGVQPAAPVGSGYTVPWYLLCGRVSDRSA